MMRISFSRFGTISQDCDYVSMPRPSCVSEEFLNSSSELYILLMAPIGRA